MVEVVSLGVEVEAGGSVKVEVGCQEEVVEMGTRRMMHWAQVWLLGKKRYKYYNDFSKNSIFFPHNMYIFQ